MEYVADVSYFNFNFNCNFNFNFNLTIDCIPFHAFVTRCILQSLQMFWILHLVPATELFIKNQRPYP